MNKKRRRPAPSRGFVAMAAVTGLLGAICAFQAFSNFQDYREISAHPKTVTATVEWVSGGKARTVRVAYGDGGRIYRGEVPFSDFDGEVRRGEAFPVLISQTHPETVAKSLDRDLLRAKTFVPFAFFFLGAGLYCFWQALKVGRKRSGKGASPKT